VLYLADVSAADELDGAPPAPEIAEYQDDFGVSPDKATANLELQGRGAGVVELLKATLDKDYAGVWFDNAAGEFVVPKLPATSEKDLTNILANLGLVDSFRTTPATSSWAELEDAQRAVNRELDALSGETYLSLLDPRKNAVVVRVASDTSPEEDALLDRVKSQAESRVEVEIVDVEKIGIEELACLPAVKTCGRPLRAGVGIGAGLGPSKGPYCTAAFKAIGNQFGNRFMLTAGHCATGGQSFKAEDYDSVQYKEIGVVEESNSSPGDWAKIKANGSFWDTSPWPSVMALWGTSEQYSIAAETASYVGEYACHEGLATYVSCAPVVALNVYDESDGQEHLTMFGPACAGEGDSGGPVWNNGGHVALGIFSGRLVPAPGCGQEYMLYAEITEAADAMGVTVGPRLGSLPYAGTDGADNVRTHSATLHGVVAPHALATNYWFDYGTTTAYGQSTPQNSAGSGWGKGGVSAVVESLQPNTTYHFRTAAQNAAGLVYGYDEEFTTPDLRPALSLIGSTEVKAHSAKLNATINSRGFATTYQFEYGTTAAYGTKVPIPSGSIALGADIAVSQLIGGLEIDTTYHFRIVATNSEGTSVSDDFAFRTPAKPVVVTEAPFYTNTFEPQLNGTVDPERAPTTYQFEYGPTTSYGTKIPVAAEGIGGGDAAIPLGKYLEGLSRESTYHYRVVAENEVGISKGDDQSFTTLPECKVEEVCSWSAQNAVEPPQIIKDEMKGVSCASSSMCVAVGQNLDKSDSFVQLWNGTSWSLIQSVPGVVKQVSCASATACVAVGAAPGGGISSWLIYTMSGSWVISQSTPPTPAGGTEASLRSVSCTPTACTAVGSYKDGMYKSLIERWNGSAWSLQTAPGPLNGLNAMQSVSCPTANFCATAGEAAGKPVAGKWSGGPWSSNSVPSPSGAKGAELAGISCVSSTFCIAVGDYYETAGGEKTLIERWNGSSWSILASPNPSGAKGFVNLAGVSCTSSSSCTATGYYVSALGGGQPSEVKTLAEAWNGTEWAIQSTPSSSIFNALLAVSCTTATACTSVGGAANEVYGAPSNLVERWNGSSWAVQTPVNPSSPAEGELKGVACGSTTICIAVGRDLYRKGSFVELWDGAGWKLLESKSGEIRDVSCASATACVAVGVNSGGGAESWLIYAMEGGWVVAPSTPPAPAGGTEATLRSVSCTPTGCTAVGSYKNGSGTYQPLVVRWNGSAWSLQSAPSPASGSAVNAMLSVGCKSATACLAVGEAAGKPFAEAWDGSQWSVTPQPPVPTGTIGAQLTGVSCGAPLDCIAVGDYYETAGGEKTLIERWNGSGWETMSSPNPSVAKGFVNLTDVSCLSPRSCFAVGYYASAVSAGVPTEDLTLGMEMTKSAWTLQSTANAVGQKFNGLFGVSCTSSIACTAVGAASSNLYDGVGLLAERYE